MPKVELKGITTILSSKKAVLEITEPGGKGGTQSKILVEGERVDSVEVLTINADAKEPYVTVRIGDTETNLTFAKVEAGKSGPAAPAAGPTPVFRPPGFPATPGVLTPTMINPAGAAAASPSGSSVFVMGAGGTPAATGGGVVTYGAATPATTGGAVPGVPSAASLARPAINPAVPTAYGTPGVSVTTDGGIRTIPTRPIRTDTPTATPTPTAPSNMKPMTREEVDLLIEINREKNRGKNMPPLPPTSLSPFIDHPDTKHFPPSMQPPPAPQPQ